MAPREASAHAFDPAVLEVRVEADGLVDLTLRVPPALEARLAAAPRLRWPEGCRVVDRRSAGALRLDCRGAALAAGLAFGVDGLEGEQAEVLAHALLPDGSDRAAALHGDGDVLRVPAAPRPGSDVDPGPRAVFTSYLGLGARHILAGFDHLAFLAALLLLVPGAAALVKTVTAFTLAHGVTVVASAYGGLSLPQAPVEALIAASIVLLSRELLRPPARAEEATLVRRAPALSALGFGLLHGLGFAAALGEAGLPASHVPLALLGFNLGVEGGQLAVVALLTPLLLALSRASRRARTSGEVALPLRLPAYAIGAVASAWLLLRLSAVVGGGVLGSAA